MEMNNVEIEYYEMVKNLAKGGDDILKGMIPLEAHLLHMVLGIAGETGELVDAIKKGVIYGKPLDIPNIIEELGDIEFYMQGLRQGMKITRMECLRANMLKLSVRYEGFKYSNEKAIARKDKD